MLRAIRPIASAAFLLTWVASIGGQVAQAVDQTTSNLTFDDKSIISVGCDIDFGAQRCICSSTAGHSHAYSSEIDCQNGLQQFLVKHMFDLDSQISPDRNIHDSEAEESRPTSSESWDSHNPKMGYLRKNKPGKGPPRSICSSESDCSNNEVCVLFRGGRFCEKPLSINSICLTVALDDHSEPIPCRPELFCDTSDSNTGIDGICNVSGVNDDSSVDVSLDQPSYSNSLSGSTHRFYKGNSKHTLKEWKRIHSPKRVSRRRKMGSVQPPATLNSRDSPPSKLADGTLTRKRTTFVGFDSVAHVDAIELEDSVRDTPNKYESRHRMRNNEYTGQHEIIEHDRKDTESLAESFEDTREVVEEAPISMERDLQPGLSISKDLDQVETESMKAEEAPKNQLNPVTSSTASSEEAIYDTGMRRNTNGDTGDDLAAEQGGEPQQIGGGMARGVDSASEDGDRTDSKDFTGAHLANHRPCSSTRKHGELWQISSVQDGLEVVVYCACFDGDAQCSSIDEIPAEFFEFRQV